MFSLWYAFLSYRELKLYLQGERGQAEEGGEGGDAAEAEAGDDTSQKAVEEDQDKAKGDGVGDRPAASETEDEDADKDKDGGVGRDADADKDKDKDGADGRDQDGAETDGEQKTDGMEPDGGKPGKEKGKKKKVGSKCKQAPKRQPPPRAPEDKYREIDRGTDGRDTEPGKDQTGPDGEDGKDGQDRKRDSVGPDDKGGPSAQDKEGVSAEPGRKGSKEGVGSPNDKQGGGGSGGKDVAPQKKRKCGKKDPKKRTYVREWKGRRLGLSTPFMKLFVCRGNSKGEADGKRRQKPAQAEEEKDGEGARREGKEEHGRLLSHLPNPVWTCVLSALPLLLNGEACSPKLLYSRTSKNKNKLSRIFVAIAGQFCFAQHLFISVPTFYAFRGGFQKVISNRSVETLNSRGKSKVLYQNIIFLVLSRSK